MRIRMRDKTDKEEVWGGGAEGSSSFKNLWSHIVVDAVFALSLLKMEVEGRKEERKKSRWRDG